MDTDIGHLNFPGMGCISIGFKSPKPLAAKSRAIPLTPNASGLLGVMAISTTASTFSGSFFNSQLPYGSPISPEESSIIPSCSSDSSISLSEHIIPWLSIPRILPTPIVVSIPGTYTPGFATTTKIPSLAFGAPQIICVSPLSVSTLQTRNLSASSCFSALIIFPIVKSFSFLMGSLTSSTSRPKSVKASTTSSNEAVVLRCSFNQENVNFIVLVHDYFG